MAKSLTARDELGYLRFRQLNSFGGPLGRRTKTYRSESEAMPVPTLDGWFESVYAVTYEAGCRPRTLEEYRVSLGKWKAFTDDPPLDAIDSLMLGRFKAWLLESEQLARATVNKHLRHVHAILGKAGPPGPGNRDAAGLIATSPWTKPLKELERLPRSVESDVLGSIYQASRFAHYPELEDIKAADWWRALMVLAYTSGFRRGALMSLVWSQVDVANREFRIAAEDDKCGRERRKPLHRLAVVHLVKIRTADGRVFPWPHSMTTFYRQWHRIQIKADIERADHIKLHDLKRTCGSIAAELGSAFAVQKLLDHGSVRTSQLYVNPTKELRGVVDAFPIPAAFEET